MKFSTLALSGCLAAALILAPGISQAASVETLKELHETALDAADCADQLEGAARTYKASWEVYARLLEALKEDVNSMGRTLHQAAIGESAPANQKVALTRASIALGIMAENTQAAMAYMQDARATLWSPAYMKYVANISAQAGELVNSLARAVHAAPAAR